jgi:hypothetical protein
MQAPLREAAEKDIAAFAEEYGAKYPKAVETLKREQGKQLAFFDFPAEHWIHIRTSNPIESAFATVRLRQRSYEGGRLASAGAHDGIQAARDGPAALATTQRSGAAPARARRRPVQGWASGGTRRSADRRPGRGGRHLIIPIHNI